MTALNSDEHIVDCPGESRHVPAFEPVLSRNWNVPDSHTLQVYESHGGYRAAARP